MVDPFAQGQFPKNWLTDQTPLLSGGRPSLAQEPSQVIESNAEEESRSGMNDVAMLSDTLGKMRQVLEEKFGLATNPVEPGQSLDSLGLDSLTFIEYVFALEKELGIVLPDVPRDLVTVEDFARYVSAERIRQAKNGHGS